MSIQTVYEMLYLSYYSWSKKINGDDYYNDYSASIMMALVIVINLTTLYSVATDFLDIKFFSGVSGMILITSLLVILSVVNYFYFNHQERGARILKSLKGVNIIEKYSMTLTIGTVLGSFFLLISVWFFL